MNQIYLLNIYLHKKQTYISFQTVYFNKVKLRNN